ncbi:MAG: O-antigen ligase family protein [Gemmatimonadetes bacterium]|nr:O-antigen ligase family protein [Gemmatimonadota bacterium]
MSAAGSGRRLHAQEAGARAGAALGPALVALLGAGLVTALAGTAAGDDALAVGGAVAAACALVPLMAAGRVDPILVLVLSLPLPALFASSDLRLAPAAIVTALVVVAWFLAWGPSRRPLPLLHVPMVGLAAFLGSYALAGLFTPHRAAAAREIVNLVALGLLLLAAVDLLVRRPGEAGRMARIVAAVGGVTGALAMLEAVGVLPGRFPEPSGLNRAALGFGQPNGLGMYLALSLPLAVHVRAVTRTAWGRGAATLALAALAGGLVATLSRGSALSVVAGALVLAMAGAWRTTLKVWAAALLAAIVAGVATGGAVFEVITGVVSDWSVAQRAALMLAGVRLFLLNPLTGVGPGGFAEELDQAGVLVPALWDLKPTPHNAYVQVAAEAGLVGLAGFLLFLGVVFHRLLVSAREKGLAPEERNLRLALLWVFAIALAEGMVEWPFSHGHGQLVILVVAAGYARASRPWAGSP